MPIEGFFKPSQLLQTGPRKFSVARCELCRLYKTCKTPKMKVSGQGRLKVLIVGEAPGAEEDAKGNQFVGKAGIVLRHELTSIGINLDTDCWKTNALICRPPNNATPTPEQIAYCRPNLLTTIKELSPTTIILLGGVAAESLIGELWKEKIEGINRWAGFQIAARDPNSWICPTYHPSYIMRSEESKNPDRALKVTWIRHLKEAFEKTEKPWTKIRDYENEVRIEMDVTNAAKLIDKCIDAGGPAAFDYETNCLKPETPGAAIASCSISWRGKRTFAYPWHGEAIAATRRFLRSPLPKVGANMKFEERWSNVHLKTSIRNPAFDIVNGAHIIDNRPGITSTKFQCFVHLGMAAYNKHIEPFFETNPKTGLNRIFSHIDMKDLLLYNGIDSLVEYETAVRQMHFLGLEF